MDRDSCVILYHVAKTAGRSLTAWIQDNGYRLWVHYDTLHTLPEPPRSTWEGQIVSFLDADVYMGHWTPGFKEAFLRTHGMRRNCWEVTILREPYDRTSSILFWWNPALSTLFREGGDQGRSRVVSEVNRLLRHPRQDDRRYDEYFNNMCRQFSGLEAAWDRYSLQYGTSWNATCDVELAWKSMQRLDSILFVDDFAQVLTMFATWLGPPRLLRNRRASSNASSSAKRSRYRLNKTPNPGFGQLPVQLQVAIKAANRADRILFMRARDHWQPQAA